MYDVIASGLSVIGQMAAHVTQGFLSPGLSLCLDVSLRPIITPVLAVENDKKGHSLQHNRVKDLGYFGFLFLN